MHPSKLTQITAGSLALLVASASFVAARDALSPAQVLENMHVAQSGVSSIVARIEQVKSYPQLGIEDPPERGHFYLDNGSGSKASRVRMEIEEPETRILTVSDGAYVLYQPRIKQAIEGRLGGGGKTALFSGILTGSGDARRALETDYRLQEVDAPPAESRDVYGLRFTALPGASVFCRQIEIFVDAATFLPVRQTCHEANESVITFTLTEVTLDGPVEDHLFELDLPRDVEKLQS